jgi:hypothetical protein
MDIKPGKYLDAQDGKTYVVLNGAIHTESNYRMVVMHEEGNDKDWKATPIEVFRERIRKGGSEIQRFARVKEEATAQT